MKSTRSSLQIMNSRKKRPSHSNVAGFTLIELLVSMAVLSVLMLTITSVIGETQKAWTRSVSRATQFREARGAFDRIVRSISQSTLNTYWDYYREKDDDPLEPPSGYVRRSELHFICGPAASLLTATGMSGHAIFFQAPLGVSDEAQYEKLNHLLSARGYFIQHGSDAPFRPSFLSGLASPPVRYRFRLMEFAPPTENNLVYAMPENWFKSAGSPSNNYARPIAENLVALFISPKVSRDDLPNGKQPTYIAPDYRYDSKLDSEPGPNQGTQHLLPPLVEVTLVAIDETSALRLEDLNGSGMPNLLDASGAQFGDASKFREDLAALEAYLVEQKLNFRVFTTTVALRTSKWSL